MTESGGEAGQAALLLFGVLAAVLAGVLVLFAFGQALGARGREQRAADLAAVSAAAAMRRVYPRLFEPAFLRPARPGLARRPNPRHLPRTEYLAIARDAAARGARANGAWLDPADVSFPGGSFAPTRVRVRIRAHHQIRAPGLERGRVEIKAQAVAELAPNAEGPGLASGGGYSGPLAHRQGKPTPHLFPAGVADALPELVRASLGSWSWSRRSRVRVPSLTFTVACLRPPREGGRPVQRSDRLLGSPGLYR